MEAPENIGSALKSIISRYGELKTSPATLIDAEGEELNFNKVDTALKSVGVSMHDANGQFRAFDDVIMDLAKTWQTLDRNSQRYIATVMAGNRQQSRFIALVSDYERLSELTEEAANAQDAGTLQYLKTLDSIETKVNQLQVAFQEFYTSMGLEDLFKGALDTLTGFITQLNSLPKIFETIPVTAIGMGINLVTAVKNILTLLSVPISQSINRLKTSLEGLAGISYKIKLKVDHQAAISDAEAAGKEMVKAVQDQADKNPIKLTPETSGLKKFLSNDIVKNINSILGSVIQVAGATLSMTALAKGDSFKSMSDTRTEGSKISSGLFGTGGNVLGSALTGLATGGWVGGLVGIGVGLAKSIPNIITLIDGLNASIDEQITQLDKEIEKQKEQVIIRKNEVSTLENAAKKLKDLEKHQYDSTEAQQEYIDYMNSLADEHHGLVESIDQEGNSVISLNSLYKELITTRSLLAKETLLQEQQELSKRQKLVEAATATETQLMAKAWDFTSFDVNTSFMQNSVQKLFSSWFSQSEMGQLNSLYDEMTGQGYVDSLHEFLLYLRDSSNNVAQELYKKSGIQLDDENGFIYTKANLSELKSQLINSTSDSALSTIKWFFEDLGDNLFNEIFGQSFKTFNEKANTDDWVYAINKYEVWRETRAAELERIAEISEQLSSVNQKRADWANTMKSATDNIQQLYAFTNDNLSQAIATRISANYNPDSDSLKWNELFNNLFNQFNTDIWSTLSETYGDLMSYTFKEVQDIIAPSLANNQYAASLSLTFDQHYQEQRNKLYETFENGFNVLGFSIDGALSTITNNFAPKYWSSILSQFQGANQYFTNNLKTQGQQMASAYYQMLENIAAINDRDMRNQALSILTAGDLTSYEGIEALKTSFENYANTNAGFDATPYLNDLNVIESSLTFNVNTLVNTFVDGLKDIDESVEKFAKNASKGLSYEDAAAELTKLQITDPDLLFSDVYEFDENVGAFVYTLDGYQKAQANTLKNYNEQYNKTNKILIRQKDSLNELLQAQNRGDFDNLSIYSQLLYEQWKTSGLIWNEWYKEQKDELSRGQAELDAAREAMQESVAYQLTGIFKEINFEDLINGKNLKTTTRQLQQFIIAKYPKLQDGITDIVDQYIVALSSGGQNALDAYKQLIEDTSIQFDYDTAKNLYLGAAGQTASAITELLGAQVGDVISKETAELVGLVEGIDFDAEGNLLVLHSAEDFLDEAMELYNKVRIQFEGGQASLADLNAAYTALIKGQIEPKRNAIDLISKSAELDIDDLELYANLLGEPLEKILQSNFYTTKLGNGKFKLNQSAIEKLINQTDLDRSNIEVIEALQERNKTIIENDRQIANNIKDTVNNLVSANVGDTVDITALQKTYGRAVNDYFSGNVTDGLAKITSDTNIPGLIRSVINATSDGTTMLESDIAELQDVLDQLFKTYADLIGKGIAGTLSNTDALNLSNVAKQFGFNGKLDFTETKEGLKLSRDSAIELYHVIKQTDAIAGSLVLDSLVDSLEQSDDGFNNISKTMAKIKSIEDELTTAEGERREQLNKELVIYSEIARVQKSRADSYSFMDNALPEGMQGPENYWNAVGQAYKVMNESATSGYMEIQDFYNIVNEMQNLAVLSGKNLEFMGKTLYADGTGAAELITWAMDALANVDGEGVKINLSELGVDVSAGADSMSKGFDAGVQELARSQIKMLDAEIALLEAIVAMEDLGQIDTNGNGLDFEEVFDNSTISGFSAAFDKQRKIIFDYLNGSDKLRPLLSQLKIGSATLGELLTTNAKGLRDLGLSDQEYLDAMNAFVQAALDNNMDPDNILDSLRTHFEGLSKIVTFTNKEGVTYALTPNGKFINFSIDSKEFQENYETMATKALSELPVRPFKEIWEDYINGQQLTDINERFTVEWAMGRVTYKYDEEKKVIEGYSVNGQMYDTMEQALSALALSDVGVDLSAETTEIDLKGSGTAVLNWSVPGEVRVNVDPEGNIEYQYNGGNPLTKEELISTIAKDLDIKDAEVPLYINATPEPRIVDERKLYNNKKDALKKLNEIWGDKDQLGEAQKQLVKMGIAVELTEEDFKDKWLLDKITNMAEGTDLETTLKLNTNYTNVSDAEKELLTETAAERQLNITTVDKNGLLAKAAENALTILEAVEKLDGSSSSGTTTPTGPRINIATRKQQVIEDNRNENTATDQTSTLSEQELRKLASLGINSYQDLSTSNEITQKMQEEYADSLTQKKRFQEFLATNPTEESYEWADNWIGDAAKATQEFIEAQRTAAEQQAQESIANGNTQDVSAYLQTLMSLRNNYGLDALSQQDQQNLFSLYDSTVQTSLRDTIVSIFDLITGNGNFSKAYSTYKAEQEKPEKVSAITEELTAATEDVIDELISTMNNAMAKQQADARTNLPRSKISDFTEAGLIGSISFTTSTSENPVVESAEEVQQTAEETFSGVFNGLGLYIQDLYDRLTFDDEFTPEDFAIVSVLNDLNTELTDSTGIESAKESWNVDIAELMAKMAEGSASVIELGDASDSSQSYITNLAEQIDAIPDRSSIIKTLNGAISSLSSGGYAANSALGRVYSRLQEIATTDFKITIKTDVVGGSTTSEAKGNALARGRGTLMGELGPELWVSGGHYYVAGQNGAEFVDLPDDAIVFNHLQTKKLLGSGKGGRGTAVTNEKNAVARASGTTGPAMASAREALAQLKQIRAMWQAMLGATAQELGSMAGRGGGGSQGGSDGEKFSPELGDYERWYNWLRQIEKLEQQITLEEAKRENMRNGHAYGKSLQDEIDKLHKEIEVSQELSDKQKEFYELRRQEQAKSMFGQIFTYDQDGLMQYRENVVDDLLAKLNETDEHGNLTGAAESAVKQVSYLQDWIAAHPYKDENGNVTTFDLSDLMIDPETGKKWKANNEEDAAKIMERFWDEFDGWIDELDGLYDSYNDKLKDIEDLIAKENELLQEYVDNQLELEDRIMKAIEAREQALIDTMNKEKDALAEASSAYITGLTDALNKERQMYDRNKDDQETTRLQRQLGILQRSGGSAAEIRSLQEQISDRLQDSYFDAQQAQIDADKEASDLELERLEQQIEIAQETLDFYKEHGLFNEEMEAIMRGSDEEIISFITTHDGEWAGLSELAHDEQLRELTQMVQLWTEDRGKEMGWKEWRDAALQADKTLTAGDLDKFHDVYGTTFKAALDSGDSPEVARAKATAAAEAELQKHKAKGTGETQQEETTTTTQTETETKQFEPFTGSISSGGRYLYEQPSESSKKIGHFGPEAGTGKSFTVLNYDPSHPGWGYVKVGKQEGWARLTGGSIDLETQRKVGVSGGSSVSTGGQGSSQVKAASEGSKDTTIGKVQDPITGDWITTEELNRRLAIRQGISVNKGLTPSYNTSSVLGNLPASTIDNTNNSRIINFYDSHFELASETTQDVIMELNQKMNPYVK